MFYDDPAIAESAEAFTSEATKLRGAMRDEARNYIRKLQNDLHEQGVDIQSGVELKFHGRKGKNALRMDADVISDILKPIDSFEAARKNVGGGEYTLANARKHLSKFHRNERSETTLNTIFKINSGILLGAVSFDVLSTALSATAIKDILVDHIGKHYEATFTNKRAKRYGKLDELADDVETARELLAANAKKLNVDSIEFGAGRYKQTFGTLVSPDIHLNFSAWKDGENLFAKDNVINSCEASILQTQKEAALLRFDSQTAHRDINEGNYNPARIGKNSIRNVADFTRRRGGASVKQRKGDYLEDRLLLATSDPLLNIAGNLGAIYEGLVRAGAIENHILSHAPSDMDTSSKALPDSYDHSRHAFSTSTWNRNVLGEKFCGAIEAYHDFIAQNAIIQPQGHNPFENSR